ncbi:hypothetical protein S40288_06982 [Stachybotrys chartarum IBT 40288]|nr:hypothetical protein S40288_06982 [Stachybotrys chartarum IBT 40288]
MKSCIITLALLGVASTAPHHAKRQNACFLVGNNELPGEVADAATALANVITCTGETTISGVPDVVSNGISFSSINFATSGQTPLEFALSEFATSEPLANNNLDLFQDRLNTYLATEAGLRSVGGSLAIKVPKFFLQFQMARIREAQGNPSDVPGATVEHQLEKVVKNAGSENPALIAQPAALVLPGHLQHHMYYNHLILTIYELLSETQHGQQAAVRQVMSQSRRYLYTHIRLYYLRHGSDAMDLFIVIPLTVARYNCVDAINDQTPNSEIELLRSPLILIAKGLYKQRQDHYLARALFQVIRSKMRPQELRLSRDMVHPIDEIDARKDLAQTVRSSWPVSVVKKDELDSHVLTKLIEGVHFNVNEIDIHHNGSSGTGLSP